MNFIPANDARGVSSLFARWRFADFIVASADRINIGMSWQAITSLMSCKAT